MIVTLLSQVDDIGMEMPWGLQLDDALQLRGVDKVSVAGKDDKVLACAGMVLSTVNDTPVQDAVQAAMLMEGCRCITLCFRSTTVDL